MNVAGSMSPELVSLDDAPNVQSPSEPSVVGARSLSGLEKPVWESMALPVQARIADAVIHRAPQAMPFELRGSASRLEAVLSKGCSAPGKEGTGFSRQLAARAEVHPMDGGDDGDVASGRVDERSPARIIDDILWASAPLVP